MTLIQQLASRLEQVINSGRTNWNEWLEDEQGQIYIRVSRRHIDGQWRLCLDLSNINIKNKGQKVFTNFLAFALKQAAKYRIYTYVENVLEERFQKFFEEQGFTRISGTNPPCFYMPTF